jgi:hypothetical protein
MIGKSNGKRPFGASNHRREDNIKSYLKLDGRVETGFFNSEYGG